jgi:hypothetical protein
MGRGTLLEDTKNSAAVNNIGLWKSLVGVVCPS